MPPTSSRAHGLRAVLKGCNQATSGRPARLSRVSRVNSNPGPIAAPVPKNKAGRQRCPRPIFSHMNLLLAQSVVANLVRLLKHLKAHPSGRGYPNVLLEQTRPKRVFTH